MNTKVKDLLRTIENHVSGVDLSQFGIDKDAYKNMSIEDKANHRRKFGDDTEKYIVDIIRGPLSLKGVSLYTTKELINKPELEAYYLPMLDLVESLTGRPLNPKTDEKDLSIFDSFWGDFHIFTDDAYYPILNIDLKLPLHPEEPDKYKSGTINLTSRNDFLRLQNSLSDMTCCRYLSMSLSGNNVIILDPADIGNDWFGDYSYTVISQHC